MSRTITLEDALNEGIATPGHYFLTEAPEDRCVIATNVETGINWNQKFEIKAGEQKIWLLGDGLRMIGEPTKENLALKGCDGFEKGPDTMHLVASGIYSISDIFDQVRACSLPEKTYLSYEVKNVLTEEANKYQHPADKKLWYWLASRCVYIGINGALFDVFYAHGGKVESYSLYDSDGSADASTNAVRPEATPNRNLLLDIDGMDGSREKPWRCLGK